MKLAICHPVIEPQRGGSETYLTMLLARLCADGHDVHLICSRCDPSALPSSLTVHPVPDFAWPRLLRPWRFTWACKEVLQRLAPDLSLGFDKVAHVDVLYPLGGLHQASIDYSRGRFAAGWQRWIANVFRRLDPSHFSMAAFERHQYSTTPRPFILAISEFVRQHYPRYLSVPDHDIAVLHAAIDTARLSATDRPARRDRTRQAWGVQPHHVVALFVGHNPRLKGLSVLFQAIAQLSTDRHRFRLGVLSLNQPSAYQREAQQLGILDNVLFLGYQPDIRDAYFAADLLIHPTFYDPCSLVVLEAQAAGLPVITTRQNGAAERLHPPTDSLVIDAPEVAPLKQAIEKFLDDDFRRHCARAALRSANKWTFDDHYRCLMNHLTTALQRKRAA